MQQGAVLSPLLFFLFLNDVEKYLNKAPFQGVKVGACNINTLLYADDMIILSDTYDGLQLLMKRLELYCNKWRLTVNVDKTKVVIFNSDLFKKDESEKYINFNTEFIESVDM